MNKIFLISRRPRNDRVLHVLPLLQFQLWHHQKSAGQEWSAPPSSLPGAQQVLRWGEHRCPWQPALRGWHRRCHSPSLPVTGEQLRVGGRGDFFFSLGCGCFPSKIWALSPFKAQTCMERFHWPRQRKGPNLLSILVSTKRQAIKGAQRKENDVSETASP